MAFFLSYLLTHTRGRGNHISLALSECEPGETPKMLFRVGFFATGQVELEDRFMTIDQRRTFKHKTYPISNEEMEKLMLIINEDRRMNPEDKLMTELYLDRDNILAKKDEYHRPIRKRVTLQSIPGGPNYNTYLFNCKTYALSVMRKIGIVDPSLNNWLIDIPMFSGPLEALQLEEKEGKILQWKSPLKLTKRLDSNRLDPKDTKDLEGLEFTIQYNEFKSCLHSIMQLLEDSTLEIKGINDLRHDFLKIQRELKNNTAKPTPEFLVHLKHSAQDALGKFETKLKSEPNTQAKNLGFKLLNAIQSALRYLGSKITFGQKINKKLQHKKAEHIINYYQEKMGHAENVLRGSKEDSKSKPKKTRE